MRLFKNIFFVVGVLLAANLSEEKKITKCIVRPPKEIVDVKPTSDVKPIPTTSSTITTLLKTTTNPVVVKTTTTTIPVVKTTTTIPVVKTTTTKKTTTTTTTKKTTTTTKKTTTTTKKSEPTSSAGSNKTLPNISGGITGKTTRYWDCCLPTCSWKENTKGPVINACKKDGTTIIPNFDYTYGSVCSGGTGYMCNNNQPWALNDEIAFGFVAASLTTGSQKENCCSCLRLQFTSGPVKGKQMIVQVTNTGNDLSTNHFDLQIPGGGVGAFNGCSNQWQTGNDGWGQRYGGISSRSECASLPAALRDGCYWRFDWFNNSDNPSVVFEHVQCPVELTSKSGCVPVDNATRKQIPWN